MASFNATLPANGTSEETAALSWQAADASAVSYQCRLGLDGGAPQQGPVQALQAAGPLPGPPLTLGQWAPCAPPLQLSWLLPGACAMKAFPFGTILNPQTLNTNSLFKPAYFWGSSDASFLRSFNAQA